MPRIEMETGITEKQHAYDRTAAQDGSTPSCPKASSVWQFSRANIRRHSTDHARDATYDFPDIHKAEDKAIEHDDRDSALWKFEASHHCQRNS